ncbi:MAG: alpha/beta fold hydrolase [Kofleriaceae bacterium]
MRSLLAAAALGLLAGCPQFHADKLPGAPADATFVEVDGVHVRYREAGSGPAVVLVHGYSASSDSWLPVIPALAASHRVIAVDLKGFGWSSRPDGDYSPAAQAQLVWAVLDRLRVTDVAIVGHSWGSSVALAMAVAKPQRVRRVALYSAYVYDDQVPSFFRWAEKSGLGELLFGLYYRERIEDRAALAYYDERWVTQARVEKLEADMARPGTVAAALATARRHQFGQLHDQLHGFDKPVLLLWGDNDQVTPVRFGQRLVGELAHADLKTYPRCGHVPMVEAPQSTRDLAAFLAVDHVAPPPPAEPAPPAVDGGGGAVDSIPVKLSGGGDADVESGFRLKPPSLVPDQVLPIGADLAVLGIELTPRLYAAPRDKTEVVIHGALRVRDAQLYNLDLDRGLDARGQPVFPVPLGGGQRIDSLDLRARTDLAFYARGVGVAVKARIDWLDNVALGGDPDLGNGSPATSSGQRPTAVVIKRAWGEALTPFGTLAIGRMGAHFGLGINAHGGDCEDCDGGNAADRAAFVAPIAGHLLAFAYDIAASGPFTQSRDGTRALALEPTDRAAGPTVAVLKIHSPAALARRADAGLASIEYGLYVTRRTQDRDVPASYLPTATTTALSSNDLVARGFSTTVTGGWLRATNRAFRLEAELVYAHANLEQPSLIPGAEITTPVTSDQLGLAIESDVTLGRGKLGIDGGYASGDSAPGFGAFPKFGDAAPQPGSFDGAQANPPGDTTVDNFRFHPDYHIDQILFREIIGTITDAVYLRPHARIGLLAAGPGRLEFGAALVASWAVEAASTPSGQKALGIELDPELRYATADGFAATLTYGVLFPGAAFDSTNLEARPAQALRARVAFAF